MNTLTGGSGGGAVLVGTYFNPISISSGEADNSPIEVIAKLVVESGATDSDGDGIVDSSDNCPNCGKIVETPCPDIQRKPKKVTADKSDQWALTTTNNNIACPHCYKTIYLHWYF